MTKRELERLLDLLMDFSLSTKADEGELRDSIGHVRSAVDERLDRLAAALRTTPDVQVEQCNWCPGSGPLVRHHPRGQVPHVP